MKKLVLIMSLLAGLASVSAFAEEEGQPKPKSGVPTGENSGPAGCTTSATGQKVLNSDAASDEAAKAVKAGTGK